MLKTIMSGDQEYLCLPQPYNILQGNCQEKTGMNFKSEHMLNIINHLHEDYQGSELCGMAVLSWWSSYLDSLFFCCLPQLNITSDTRHSTVQVQYSTISF